MVLTRRNCSQRNHEGWREGDKESESEGLEDERAEEWRIDRQHERVKEQLTDRQCGRRKRTCCKRETVSV